MPHFAVIDAPSNLGLKPNGVEHLPEALKAAGLLTGLHAEDAGRVEPPPFNPRRDPETQILNPDALRVYALQLSAAVAGVLRQGKFPLVRDEDIVAFGFRDAEESKEYGSQDIRETAIHAFDLHKVRELGAAVAAEQASVILRRNVEGFWIPVDADVLDDAVMPAVEYHLTGGLSWDELTATLRALMATGQAVGLNVGIYNPAFDKDGSIARGLVASLVAGTAGPGEGARRSCDETYA